MSPHDNDLPHEEQLLQHFREHSQGEPSAALDARILAAARRATLPSTPRPGIAQRLHAWLFGAGSNTRWSLAFAGLATLGIGVSLTLRTQEQVPNAYDLPSPATAQAPVMHEMAPRMVAKQAAEPAREAEQKKAEVVRQRLTADSSVAFRAPPPAAMARQSAPAKPAAAPPAESMVEMSIASAEAVAREAAEAKAAAQVRARTQLAQAQADQASAGLADTLAEESAPLVERLREVLRLRREGQGALAEQLLQHLTRIYPHQNVPAVLRQLEEGE